MVVKLCRITAISYSTSISAVAPQQDPREAIYRKERSANTTNPEATRTHTRRTNVTRLHKHGDRKHFQLPRHSPAVKTAQWGINILSSF